MNLQDAVCVVTGGASGLGAATVRRLSSRGASVVILDRDADKGENLAAELGDKVAFAATDVTDADSVESGLAVASGMGSIRAAICCAGIGWAARTLNREGVPHDLGMFQKVIEVNLVGTFNVLRLASAAMGKCEPDETGERGVIVTTASVAAFDGQIGQIAYAASKAGVVGMTLPAARDLSPLGIRVNTIAPGVFNTPMMSILPEKAREALSATVVFPKRLGNPDEYGALVAHICENGYLNGETIRLDGSLRMAPK